MDFKLIEVDHKVFGIKYISNYIRNGVGTVITLIPILVFIFLLQYVTHYKY